MDFAPILKKIIDFIVYYWSLEFTFAGYTTSIGSVVIWCALAGLVIGIMRGLTD